MAEIACREIDEAARASLVAAGCDPRLARLYAARGLTSLDDLATTLQSLVAPERLLLSEPVDMVVVPGSEGDFGVLPGHAPLISTVRPGLIET